MTAVDMAVATNFQPPNVLIVHADMDEELAYNINQGDVMKTWKS